MTDADTGPRREAEHAPPTEGVLAATVVEYADLPDECTLWPVAAPAERHLTSWVSASEGSFVSLSEMV